MSSGILVISLVILVVVAGGISLAIWLRQRQQFVALNHYNSGVSYLHAADYPHAIKEFQAALKRRPGMPDARYGLGLAYVKQQHYHDGIKMLEAVAKVRPHNGIALYNLGMAYIHVGELEKARDTLETALSLTPDVKEIHFNLSKIFQEQGELDRARQYCQNALNLDPDYGKAREFLTLLSELRFGPPINHEFLKKALKNFDPDDIELMITL